VLDAALADPASAPVKLEEAARTFDTSPSRYRPYDTRMSLAIAAMYEALRQPERALEFVDRRPFFLIENRYRTPSLLLEGRISLQAGDTARAIRAYQQALAFLSDPEPSVEPIASETRETLAALLAQ
jgi:tetratricopeptide (TPR) repeat protein